SRPRTSVSLASTRPLTSPSTTSSSQCQSRRPLCSSPLPPLRRQCGIGEAKCGTRNLLGDRPAQPATATQSSPGSENVNSEGGDQHGGRHTGVRAVRLTQAVEIEREFVRIKR